MLTVYTDGACLNNPGPGGWGVLILGAPESPIELSGYQAQTTNNQMELTAVIQALNWMKAHNLVEVILYSDSQYVLQGITQWMTNWKRRGWMTASNDPVKNRELWQELDRATIGLKIDWRWIRGHSGDINNDRVDFLARQQALNGGRTHASY